VDRHAAAGQRRVLNRISPRHHLKVEARKFENIEFGLLQASGPRETMSDLLEVEAPGVTSMIWLALMHLISWNVNGLRSVGRNAGLDAVLSLRPDVLLLQETKLRRDAAPTALAAYHASFNSATASSHWGVATLSRIRPVYVATSVISNRRFDDEGRSILSLFPKLAVLNVYIPQGNRDGRNLAYKLDCITALTDFLKRWDGPPLLLCGDFNIARDERDLARPAANNGHVMFTTEERALFEQLLMVGYVDSLRELYPGEKGIYSWWPYAFSARTRNLGWRLDYILVPSALRGCIVDVEHKANILGSDHCPVELNLNAELT
jgi:exodeoxyribonuclease III